MKKDGSNLIQLEWFFQAQNGKGNYIRPGLFLYYKKISAYFLANQYTPLGIINDTRAIV